MGTQQPKRLGEVLVESGVITEHQLMSALEHKRGTRRRLGSTLVEMGLATETQICRAVADQQGIPVIDLNTITPDSEALQRVPAEIAARHAVVPLKVRAGRLLLVMADPLDITGLDAAWRASQCVSIDRVIAPESQVLALIQEYYGTATLGHDPLSGLAAKEAVSILTEVPGRADAGLADFNAIDAINAILGGAAESGATHVHIEPGVRRTTIRYRIDGQLRRAVMLPAGAHAALVGRLRTLFHVDPSQAPGSQEGHAGLQLGQHQVGLRLSLVPAAHGEAAVVRVLDPRRAQVRIEHLGLTTQDLAAVTEMLSQPNGLVLVAGPEDSGISTTLYALLNELSDEAASLVSVENPVEAILADVVQVEVNERAGIGWPEALRAAQRLDPDVLMIADLLDLETSRLALRAALTGQLVLAGVRSESAAGAVALLLDLGLEPYLLASTLRGIIGQRLARRVCKECQSADAPDPRSLVRLGLTSADLESRPLVRGTGCAACGDTGFVGRVGLFEVAQVRGALRQSIATKAPVLEIERAALEGGMRPLREDALEKAYAGLTTLAEVAAVVPGG